MGLPCSSLATSPLAAGSSVMTLAPTGLGPPAEELEAGEEDRGLEDHDAAEHDGGLAEQRADAAAALGRAVPVLRRRRRPCRAPCRWRRGCGVRFLFSLLGHDSSLYLPSAKFGARGATEPPTYRQIEAIPYLPSPRPFPALHPRLKPLAVITAYTARFSSSARPGPAVHGAPESFLVRQRRG
jgi:hypothetical protein